MQQTYEGDVFTIKSNFKLFFTLQFYLNLYRKI